MSLKASRGLHNDSMIVYQMGKGKSLLLPFKKGLVPRVDDPFLDEYRVSKIVFGGKEILFRPEWGINMNDRMIDPHVCAEMFDHMVLPWDIAFASQIASPKLMRYFPAALMQVRLC